MKPWYLASVWVLAWAAFPAGATVPLPQESVPPPARDAAPAPEHRPLFKLRYVLVLAPAAAPDERAIDIVDDRAAIRSLSADRSSTLLGGAIAAPNVLICRGRECIEQTEGTHSSR